MISTFHCEGEKYRSVGHVLYVLTFDFNYGTNVAKMAFEAISPYCTTKAALSQFAKCVALEEAKNGVRVNVICPGTVKTRMFKDFHENR